MPNDTMPEFPPVAGADQLSEDERQRIAEAAWAQSHGSVSAFAMLCAEHVNGDIDLFSDNPTAIARRQPRTGPGDDAFTATGGETSDTRSPASAAPPGAAATAPQPAAEQAAREGTGVVTGNNDLAGQGPDSPARVAQRSEG